MASEAAAAGRVLRRKGEEMKDTVVQGEGQDVKARRHKPRHLAEKMEAWVVRGFGVCAAVLLAFLLYSFMQTGTGVPSWMR